MIKLICLSSTIAFKSIKAENPRNIVFTSGTLPDVKVFENITGIKF